MDINLILKEIETTIELENKFINCYTHFKKEYLEYKKKLQNSIEADIKISSQELISNLELIMAYIFKHQEVKSIYNSYKIMRETFIHMNTKIDMINALNTTLSKDLETIRSSTEFFQILFRNMLDTVPL